jgi:hypothetical protein
VKYIARNDGRPKIHLTTVRSSARDFGRVSFPRAHDPQVQRRMTQRRAPQRDQHGFVEDERQQTHRREHAQHVLIRQHGRRHHDTEQYHQLHDEIAHQRPEARRRAGVDTKIVVSTLVVMRLHAFNVAQPRHVRVASTL